MRDLGSLLRFLKGLYNSASGQGYLLLTTRSGKSWPMTLTHRDLLAEDYALAS